MGKQPPGGLDAVSSAANAAQLDTATGAKRWWATVPGDASFVERWRPPRGSCVTDHNNGRFLVAYPGRCRISISWTQRGREAASMAAVRQLWSWHTEATGIPCPLPV